MIFPLLCQQTAALVAYISFGASKIITHHPFTSSWRVRPIPTPRCHRYTDGYSLQYTSTALVPRKTGRRTKFSMQFSKDIASVCKALQECRSDTKSSTYHTEELAHWLWSKVDLALFALDALESAYRRRAFQGSVDTAELSRPKIFV